MSKEENNLSNHRPFSRGGLLLGLIGAVSITLGGCGRSDVSTSPSSGSVIEAPATSFQGCDSATPQALMQATTAGALDTVASLLDCGVPANATAVWQQPLSAAPNDLMELTAPPIHAAAWNDHRDIAQLLVEAGADVNALDEWGIFPLSWPPPLKEMTP